MSAKIYGVSDLIAEGYQVRRLDAYGYRIAETVDFWPTSEKWLIVGEKRSRRGFPELRDWLRLRAERTMRTAAPVTLARRA